MTTKSRLNPNPLSRPTLKSLQEAGILRREKIGLRNIIRAGTGAVEPFGFNIGGIYDFIRDEPSLSNFRTHSRREVRGLVGYGGGRAEICATSIYPAPRGFTAGLSTHSPINRLATSILKQPCTKQTFFDPKIPMYGDAVLITDKRFHWVFSRNQVSDTEIMEFDALLTTPRTLYKRGVTTTIVFHVEPNQNDIFTIKIAWQ